MAKANYSYWQIGLLLYLSIPGAWAKNLAECFSAAAQRSELVAGQQEQINQADARYNMALGSLAPSINFVAGYTRLDTPPGSQTAFNLAERPEIKLTASQPLFKGLREYSALKQRSQQQTQAELAKQKALLDLYQDVAETFYKILSLEQELKDSQNLIELDRKRLQDLQARTKIGRSRTSEVLAVDAALASLAAEVISLKNQILVTRQRFSFLTGFNSDELLVDQLATANQAPVKDLNYYLSRLDQRADVQLARQQALVADQSLLIAKEGHLPSVDAAGNYYFKRVGVLEKQKWDVTLTATLPIFAGGVTQSQISEASSVYKQNELNLSYLRRQAEQEIRSAFDLVVADQGVLTSLKNSVDLYEKNFQEQNREYRLGLVTNLEVLQTLNSLQEAKKNYDRSLFQARLNRVKLDLATANVNF